MRHSFRILIVLIYCVINQGTIALTERLSICFYFHLLTP